MEDNFAENTYPWYEIKNHKCIIRITYPNEQWVKLWLTSGISWAHNLVPVALSLQEIRFLACLTWGLTLDDISLIEGTLPCGTMISLNGNIFSVTGPLWGESTGDSSHRPVTRSFDVFFDLRLHKRLSKQSRRRRFETPAIWDAVALVMTSFDDKKLHATFAV